MIAGKELFAGKVRVDLVSPGGREWKERLGRFVNCNEKCGG
jgi:hypothetical protein